MSSSYTIFFVDDEVDLVNFAAIQLGNKGYQVIPAHNGKEALELLKNIRPDLIILDVNMPKMGGLEFYRILTSKEEYATIPVIFLTARAELEEVLTKELKVDGFLPKPFRSDQLFAEVARVLAKSKNA